MIKTISFFVFLLLMACTPPLKLQISKPGENSVEFSQKIVYSLPRTLIKVNLSIEKETFIPGPYYQFTERFLGLDDYISEYGFQYKFLDVNIESFSEPDPEQFYNVNIQKGTFNWENYLLFSEKGFILDPSVMRNYSNTEVSDNPIPMESYFKDLSLNLNLTEITDTLYKTIITDSSLIRLPVVTTARQVKTLEQKAEEAAKNLFTLRENRFFLISNTEGDYPDGKALDVMVKEMDKMEQSYIELFVGKVVKQKFTKSIIILPNEKKKSEKTVLSGFSNVLGLTSGDSGMKLSLDVENLNQLPDLDEVPELDSKGDPITNFLYYRIPELAGIKVLLEDEVLYEGRIDVYQFGRLVNLPVK